MNHYYGTGCSDCGGWSTAGAAAAGVAVGAAVGAASAQAASQNAYAAGYAAGSAGYAMGAIYPTLPAGCMFRPVLGAYECTGVWFKPAYGANGIYYRVIPAP